MLRKLINILLTAAIIISLSACSSDSPGNNGDPVDPRYVIEMKNGGVSFELPESLRDLKGALLGNYGFEVEKGSGVYYTALLYIAMDKDYFNELNSKSAVTDEEIQYVNSRVVYAMEIFAINGNRGLDELDKFISSYGISVKNFKKLGKTGEYTFFYMNNPDGDNIYNNVTLEEPYRSELDDAVLPAMKKPSWVRIYQPETAAVVFNTVDLDGNPVSSADIFSSYTLTMVNIWGTYCGPCISEMPELEKLNKKLAEKNCTLIGIVCDVGGINDVSHVETAKEIIKSTSVTYMNLLPWNGFNSQLPSQFIPTTYFIDSQGKIVGEAVVGAKGAGDYEAIIDSLLAQMQK